MVGQQGAGVRPGGRGGDGGEGGAEVAESIRADDPEPGAGQVRLPAVDGVDVASEDSVGDQYREALALIGVLDDPQARVEPLMRSHAWRMSWRLVAIGLLSRVASPALGAGPCGAGPPPGRGIWPREISVGHPLLHPAALKEVLPNEGVARDELPGLLG
jgi:hypothetical protein